MELTEGSETSANYNLTPGKYPKEQIRELKSLFEKFHIFFPPDDGVTAPKHVGAVLV
jgi:hypothetical protein